MLAESFISVGKLIETLKEKGVIKETDTQLNVLFDNWAESKIYKSNWWVKILSFSIIGEKTEPGSVKQSMSRPFTFKEFHEIMPDIQNLNIGKQVSSSMRKLPWKNFVCRLFIRLNKVSCGDYSYYPIKVDNESDLHKYYDKLRKARSQVYIDRINGLAEIAFNKNEECFDDSSDES